jgi:hypothetical protein
MANVPTAWPDLWEWWEYCFAVAYHTAGQYGVTRFAIHNEPDRSVQGFTGRVGDYVRLLAYGADAARAGVRAANPALAATIHAPGLAEPDRHRVVQLRAVATLADGGELDLSDRVTWASTDPAIVRVNSTGLAASLDSGTAEITASWDDLGSAPATLVVRE